MGRCSLHLRVLLSMLFSHPFLLPPTSFLIHTVSEMLSLELKLGWRPTDGCPRFLPHQSTVTLLGYSSDFPPTPEPTREEQHKSPTPALGQLQQALETHLLNKWKQKQGDRKKEFLRSRKDFFFPKWAFIPYYRQHSNWELNNCVWLVAREITG